MIVQKHTNFKTRAHEKLQRILPLSVQQKFRTFRQVTGVQSDVQSDLRRLAIETRRLCKRLGIRNRVKILWSPGFNILPIFWIHDGLLAMALKMRGASITPMMCDRIQPKECAVWGGDWVPQGELSLVDARRHLCYLCSMSDLTMWDQTFGLPPLRLSAYINKEDIRQCEWIINNINYNSWPDFEFDGLPVGNWAEDMVLNNSLAGYLDGSKSETESARTIMYNTILLRSAYNSILDKHQPDRVVSHDNLYYMWGTLTKLADQRNIPYFTYYMGGLQGTWVYERGRSPTVWTIDDSWPTWKNGGLTPDQDAKLDAYLLKRQSGKGMVTNTVPSGEHAARQFGDLITAGLDLAKPTALLASGVIWDALALRRDVLFDGQFQWALETIRFFADRPDLQLIVKAHPVEEDPTLPTTRHKMLDEIKKSGVALAPNVFLLEPRTDIPATDIFPHIKVGLVYTSTIGQELTMMGKPVIVAAKPPYREKGFTYDPPTKDIYFEQINSVMASEESSEVINERIRLSRAFFFFQYFHLFVDDGLSSWEWMQQPIIRIKSAEELLPGVNPRLDHICNSIIENLPVSSDDRWPPES